METKTKYKVGDTIEFRYKDKTESAKITDIGKVYISCGMKWVFRVDTHKCISGKWDIIGTTEPKPKARPRGKSAQLRATN